jgi:SAM-dependent methyltransferase
VARQADRLPDGWRRHARRGHLELIERWVGVARGRWLKTDTAEESHPARSVLPFMAEARWVGIDVSAAALSEAVGCLCVQADVRHLPFRSGAFDGVLSTSTLDHFEDPADIDAALLELRRVLAPSGRLVLTLDNPANPLVRLRNALPARVQRRTGLVPFHVGPTLDASAGRAALRQAGFDVQAVTYVLHAPHVIGTRMARWPLIEERVLPWWDRRLAASRHAASTGHFVAFLATATPPAATTPR